MKRTAVNPWDWSVKVGYNQAEVIEGATRQVIISGQTSVDADGAPQHPGDMRAQMTLAMANLEAVLAEAGLDLSHVIKLGVYATDVDAAMQNFDVVGTRLGAAQVTPPMTLLGVARLALPDLMFEIEATAAA